MLGFTERALDTARLDKLYLRSHKQNVLKFLLDMLAELVHFLEGVAERLRLQLHVSLSTTMR